MMRLRKLHLSVGSFKLYIEELTLPTYPIIIAGTLMIEMARENLLYLA